MLATDGSESRCCCWGPTRKEKERGGSLRPQQKRGQSILLSFTAFKVGPIHERLWWDSAQPCLRESRGSHFPSVPGFRAEHWQWKNPVGSLRATNSGSGVMGKQGSELSGDRKRINEGHRLKGPASRCRVQAGVSRHTWGCVHTCSTSVRGEWVRSVRPGD